MELIISALLFIGVINGPEEYQPGMEDTFSDQIEQYEEQTTDSDASNDNDTITLFDTIDPG